MPEICFHQWQFDHRIETSRGIVKIYYCPLHAHIGMFLGNSQIVDEEKQEKCGHNWEIIRVGIGDPDTVICSSCGKIDIQFNINPDEWFWTGEGYERKSEFKGRHPTDWWQYYPNLNSKEDNSKLPQYN